MKIKKYIKYLILFIIILILIALIYFLKRTEIIQNFINKNKQEVVKDITFDIYSYENGVIKALVTAEDTENKIKQLSYLEEGKEKTINVYSKEKVAIDYEIKQDGEYTFYAINNLGETIQKTLVINSNTISDLIKINIESDREIGTVLNVNIEYSKDLNNTYKIGNSSDWKKYKGEFSITSYEVIKNNYQDLNNETVTIYAKTEDNAKNKIIISKQTYNLDLKLQDKPVIIASGVEEYPILTEDGVCVTGTIEIKYDENYETNNYYSLDNGKTWNIYNGIINTSENENKTSGTVMAKSIKKISGLEVISSATIPISTNSLDLKAYDGNVNTEIRGPGGRGKTLIQYLNIDESAYLKKCQIIQNTISQGSAGSPSLYIYFYDINDNIVGDKYNYNNVGSNYISNIICPYGAKYMKIILAGSSGWGGSSSCALKEISIVDNNEAIVSSNTIIYPILKSEGISIENSKIVYIRYPDSYTQQFYKIGEDLQWQTCDKEMQINLAVGETIYTKGIDENGNEIEGMNYTSKIESDAILENAYDGDEKTFYLAGNVATRYMEIDKSS